jgi:hypothetical protein
MTKTAFHPPHVTAGAKHSFSINDDGTQVQLTFAGQPAIVVDGVEALELRTWLNAAALRTQEEADELAKQPKPVESSGVPAAKTN